MSTSWRSSWFPVSSRFSEMCMCDISIVLLLSKLSKPNQLLPFVRAGSNSSRGTGGQLRLAPVSLAFKFKFKFSVFSSNLSMLVRSWRSVVTSYHFEINSTTASREQPKETHFQA